MPLVQLDSENGDYDLTTSVTVLTHTPSATEHRLCQAYIALGDGVKDLDGTGGDFEVIVLIGSQTVQPSPQTITFGTETQVAVWTTPFPVPANSQVRVGVKSPNAADTDVDVTAYLFDLPVGDTRQVVGSSQSATDLKDFVDDGYDPSDHKVEGCKVNDDMRGTDSAALASDWTATRAGYVDKLNVTGTLANTDNADSFKATGFSSFDPAADTVAHVTLVDTCATVTNAVTTDTASREASKADVSALATSTEIASLQGHGDSNWATATGFAVAGDAMALTAAERNSVADAVLSRGMSNVEASADKDSLCMVVLAVGHANTADYDGYLTIYQTDDTTEFDRRPITTVASAEFITGITD